MTPLLVLRHGRTKWNVEKRLQGRTDIPLSREGVTQVTGWSLPSEYDDFFFYSSPLTRAVETARLLGREPQTIEALSEMSWGQWEGKRFDDLKAQFGNDMQNNLDQGIDFRPDGGESPRDVMKRLEVFIAGLNQPTVAVAHRGVLQAFYALATGWNMRVRPPEKMRDEMAHLYMIENAALRVEQLNIPLAGI